MARRCSGRTVADLEARRQGPVVLVVEGRPPHRVPVAHRLDSRPVGDSATVPTAASSRLDAAGGCGEPSTLVERRWRRRAPRALCWSAQPIPRRRQSGSTKHDAPGGCARGRRRAAAHSSPGRSRRRRPSTVTTTTSVGGIAVRQGLVVGREVRIGRHEELAVGGPDAVGDGVHGRVVVRRSQVAEGEAVDRGQTPSVSKASSVRLSRVVMTAGAYAGRVATSTSLLIRAQPPILPRHEPQDHRRVAEDEQARHRRVPREGRPCQPPVAGPPSDHDRRQERQGARHTAQLQRRRRPAGGHRIGGWFVQRIRPGTSTWSRTRT